MTSEHEDTHVAGVCLVALWFFAELSLLDGLQLPVVQLRQLHLLIFFCSCFSASCFFPRQQSDVSSDTKQPIKQVCTEESTAGLYHIQKLH